MKTINIKNISGSSQTWLGTAIQDGYSYSLQPAEVTSWANSDDFLSALSDGYAVINNGSEDLTGLSEQINYIKGVDQKFNTEGAMITAPTPRMGSSKTIYTHNFCDPCTWYEGSLRNEGSDGYGAVLNTSDNVTYNLDGYVNWIDTTHGRLTGEDFFFDYPISVTVDGVLKTEDVDFEINYHDGYVVFDPALNGSEEVKASFSYAGTSIFTIAPSPGKKLRILYTEAQFSINVKIIEPVRFQIRVYNPYDLPNKVSYGEADVYKSGYDFANVGNGGTYIPAFADMDEDLVVVPFNYATVKDMSSSVGAEVQIRIDNDTPLDGYFGTLTAYCLSEDE